MLQSNAPAGFPFSKRYGYAAQLKGISIWEDASEDLRQCVLETARDWGLAPSDIRDIVCAVLQRRPNPRCTASEPISNGCRCPNWLKLISRSRQRLQIRLK
jgi:hypothetical protein